MGHKHHVKAVATPGRFRRVGRCATVDWREDCSRCTNCVKLRCTYDVYLKSRAHDRDPLSPLQPLYDCKACLSCVQGCTKGLLSMSPNPEYLAMGDAYWTSDIIAGTWEQADAGRIPVSGAGYRGRFAGDGFDSIWTDMSEIVRPTRDGIHGREYISTAVDIGPKPMRLSFAPDGRLLTQEAALIVTQIPAILDVPPWAAGDSARALALARAAAARSLRTLAVARLAHVREAPAEAMDVLVPLLGNQPSAVWEEVLPRVRMAEVPDGPGAPRLAELARSINPALIVGVRMDLSPASAGRVAELVGAGVRVVHLCADLHGRESGAERPRHLRDALRDVHGRLTDDGVRDEVTLIAGGGIALAEHMAKAVICGADLVAADTALLIALGCRLCRPDAAEGCPAQIGAGDVDYAAQRMVNLMGAWHSQLIEVLGAMGIREVRRLRGETGRAIFREDMEREAFGDLVRA